MKELLTSLNIQEHQIGSGITNLRLVNELMDRSESKEDSMYSKRVISSIIERDIFQIMNSYQKVISKFNINVDFAVY